MLEKVIHVKSAIFILMTSGAASINRLNPINYVTDISLVVFCAFSFASLHIPVVHSRFWGKTVIFEKSGFDLW